MKRFVFSETLPGSCFLQRTWKSIQQRTEMFLYQGYQLHLVFTTIVLPSVGSSFSFEALYNYVNLFNHDLNFFSPSANFFCILNIYWTRKLLHSSLLLLGLKESKKTSAFEVWWRSVIFWCSISPTLSQTFFVEKFSNPKLVHLINCGNLITLHMVEII